MKKTLSILLAVVITKSGWCQGHPQLIGIINDIPIVIETMPSAISHDGNHGFSILPGKLSISLMSRKKWVDFDHMIQLGKPKKINDIETVQIILVINQKNILHKKFTYKELSTNLIDTFLKEGDEWVLTIQSKVHGVNEYHLKGASTKPSIESYRLMQHFDSSFINSRPKQIDLEKATLKHFNKPPSPTMKFPPGSIPEFKLTAYPLLKDSMILYRISDKSISGPWKIANRFFALPNLIPNNNYRIELKFLGQQQSTMYSIRIQPFWFETVIAKTAVLLLSFILITTLIRWYYKNRLRNSIEQRQRLEEQLRTIQSQLNPHFIFNALSSIEGLINTGQTKLANDYLNNFSAIMRATLNNADKLFISLQQEIELLQTYIHIEQLRFGFEFNMQIQPELALHEIEVPPMLLQPLAENAIKHSIVRTGDIKTIGINFSKKESNLVCTITNPAIFGQRSGKTAGGYGLEFTQQRLAYFKRLHPETPITFSLEIANEKAITQLVYTNWFN